MLDPRFEALHQGRREALAFAPSQRLDGSRMVTMYDGGVAVMEIVGPIYRHASSAPSGAVSTGAIAKDLSYVRKLHAKGDIKSLVLALDTPGGEATGMDELAHIIHNMSKEMPVETYIEGLGASAGYYIAAPTSKITASRMALIGSIGVVIGIPIAKGQTESGQLVHESDKGVPYMEFVSSVSPNKRPNPTTKEGMAYYQQMVDETADIFVADVAQYRGLSAADLPAQYGDGGLSVAGTALKRGLVDAVDSFEHVLERLQSGGSSVANPVSVSVPEPINTDAGPETDGGNTGMRFIDKILGAKAEAPQTPETVSTGATEGRTMEEFLAELEAQRPAVEDSVVQQCIVFAQQLVLDSKIKAAQQTDVAFEMMTAMADDAQFGGKVVYAVEGEEVEGSRTEQVKAKYENAPRHTMAEERVAAVQSGRTKGQVLAGTTEVVPALGDKNDKGVDMSREEALALTEQGRAVLAAERANGNGHK